MSYVLLEDGTRFDGEAVGAPGPVTGEVVFNTAMSGYQESMTDPSYARQLITFTYPHIGNYGVCAQAMESDRIHARGAIMRDARNHEDHASAEGGWLDWLRDCGVPAISGVDTRALVRHIREAGSMRGGIFPADCAERDAAAAIVAEPSMVGLDLAREVSPTATLELEATGGTPGGPTIAVIDTGVKTSIVANLRSRGARLQLHPCTTSADQILDSAPDAVMLVNGPSSRSACWSAGCRSSGSASGTNWSAEPLAWRPTSCASVIAGPITRSRTCRRGGSTSRARTTASPCSARAASARSPGMSRCAGRPTSARPS